MVAKYEPLDDILSTETAFLQASSALDVAARFAAEHKNSEELMGIAAMWMELGSRLMVAAESEEQDEEEETEEQQKARASIGFGIHNTLPSKEEGNGGID